MPLTRFKADIRSQGGPDLRHVADLAAKYDVSKEATAIHYSSYHHDLCAILLSQNGTLRRIYKPTRFPLVEARIGTPLPHNSLSARHQTNGVESDDVDRGVWLAKFNHPSSIREQALNLAKGWKMTLLVVDDSDNEGEDEVRDTFDVWENPRFPGKSRRR